MLEEIIFITVAFILFIYIFLYKLIHKNDTTYLWIIGCQAIGILINLVQLFFNILNITFLKILCYSLSIGIPLLVIIIELRGIAFGEMTYLVLANLMRLIGNDKQAKAFAVKLVTKYDKSYYGHKMLAEIYEKEGGMRKAIDEYVKVLDIKKDDEKSYFKISVLLNDLGRKDEALQMLQTLNKRRPELYEATEMLGDILIEKERFKEAIDLYMKAIKYHPEKFEIYYNLGIAYTRMNEFELAKECYEKAAELNDEYYNAHYRLGQIALLYRDLDGAEDNFLKSLDGETEADSNFELSKIYALKNKPEKSKMFANKAVDLEPQYYNKIQEEPLLFTVKKDVVPPKEGMAPKEHIVSHKEQMVNEYLKDTYNLTKKIDLKEAKEEGINISEFKWEKGKDTKRYEKQRIDPN